MTLSTFITTASPYRSAGKAAIASGLIGILAISFLITFLKIRDQNLERGIVMLRFHDAGVILQFILMIPFVVGLHKISQQSSQGISRPILKVGIGALFFTALFLLLGIVKFFSDGLYTVPQGVFGVCLIIVSWRTKDILPSWLRWFGIVVGLGLALVGIFVPAYAIFVDTLILRIPAAPVEEVVKIPMTPANNVLHQILFVGSFMGVFTLPFWTILVGVRLLRKKIN